MTKKALKNEIIRIMADNMFLTKHHDELGNKDLSSSIIQQIVGMGVMARELGFNQAEMHEIAYKMYQERIKN